MKIYLDNAATTKVDPRVAEAMMPYLFDVYGNPSSIHAFGRETRSAIEIARKKVAELLNTAPATIFFTSGGTEADNCAITSTIVQKGIKKAITSPLEHHAVLHTLEHLAHIGQVQLTILECDTQGNLNLDQLYSEVEGNEPVFVSLMHGNNEIGNLNPVVEIAERVKAAGGIFHSDTVQTVGHYPHDLGTWKTDFMVGAAHKFHGPKGIGFLYISQNQKITPLIHGGSQERNMRGGTENLAGIIGLAKALEIACSEMEDHKKHILGLKSRMVEKLKAEVPGVLFNGRSADLENSLYTVLNVSLPPSEINEMLIFNLDINNIAASGGSACSSGSEVGSHVLRALKADPNRGAVRFSFGKYNTAEEIDTAVFVLAKMLEPKLVKA
jgi:cysteine desulfurase